MRNQKSPKTSTGTICAIKKCSQSFQTPLKGNEGRRYQKVPGGYINGAGGLCWTESYVYIYWTNDETGFQQSQDIRDKLKEKTGGARLTENRINRFLELNRGKKVELKRENHNWVIFNLDDLNYDFL